MSAARGSGQPPDLAEAVLGFRAWQVRVDGVLGAMVAGALWVPGRNEAVCSPGLSPPRGARHNAPHPGCGCGLNAYFALVQELRAAEFVAIGAIAAWGEIDVYAAGFRAQFAQVIALSFPASGPGRSAATMERLERAGTRYGVALVPASELRSEALRHASPLSSAVLPRSGRSGRRPAKRPAPPPRPVVSVASWGRARGQSVWVRRHVAVRARDDVLELGPAPAATALADPDPDVRLLPFGARVEAGGCVATIAAAYPGRVICLRTPVGGTVRAHNARFVEQLRAGDRAVSSAPWLIGLEADDAPLEDAPLLWGRPGVEIYRRAVVSRSDADVLAELAPPAGLDRAALVSLAARGATPSLAAHQRTTTTLPPERGRRAAIMVEQLRPLLQAFGEESALLAA